MGRGSADATLIAIDICRWHVPKDAGLEEPLLGLLLSLGGKM